MPEAEKNKSREAEIQAVESFDDEAEHNLFGFFSLLMFTIFPVS